MKKSTLALLFLLAAFTQNAFAQNAFEVTPNPADTTAPAGEYDSPAHAEIHNLTNDSIFVKWERKIISLTPGIETAVCDPVQCWFPVVNAKSFGMAPHQHGELISHFYNAQGIEASGIVHLKLTNLNNAADTMTAVFTYNTLSDSDADDLPAPSVRLFPNPASDFFTLENATAVASMRLFSLDGRELARFSTSPDNRYSIAQYPAGNYVLSFEDKQGRLFQAVTLNKTFK